jgi:hypothetical protein
MLAEVWRHVRMRISSLTGTFIWERTAAFLRSREVIGMIFQLRRVMARWSVQPEQSSEKPALVTVAETVGSALGRVAALAASAGTLNGNGEQTV